MKPIPPEIKIPYEAALAEKEVPLPAHFYHRKWLRDYLGFCLKYRYGTLKEENLLYFLKKLEDKNQTEQQQKQAFHAVSMFPSCMLPTEIQSARPPSSLVTAAVSRVGLGRLLACSRITLFQKLVKFPTRAIK
jgi:hypothetical protein